MIVGLSPLIVNNLIRSDLEIDEDEEVESFDLDPSYYVENEQGGLTPKWIHYAVRIADFSESVIGSKLVQKGKTFISENLGKTVGALYPEATLAYVVGKEVAKSKFAASSNKSKIVEGVGVISAVAITTASNMLPYFGITKEYWQPFGYLLSTAGGLVGGRIAYDVIGEEAPEYYPRAIVSNVTKDATSKILSAVQMIPFLPPPLSFSIRVTGVLAPSLMGLAAYNADHVLMLSDKIINAQSVQGNLYDPGMFLQNALKASNRSSDAFSSLMANKLMDSNVLTGLLEKFLKDAVDKKVAGNAFVRAVNDYCKLLQDKSIQEKFKALKATPTEKNKDLLKKSIQELVEKRFNTSEKIIAGVQKRAAPLVPGFADQIVEIIRKNEKKYFSVEVSNKEQMRLFLDTFLPSLVSIAAIYAKREFGGAKDLTPLEVENFYQNFNEIIFTPYNGNFLIQGIQGVVSTMIPYMQTHAQIVPLLLSEEVGNSLSEKKPIPRKLSKWESFLSRVKQYGSVFLRLRDLSRSVFRFLYRS